MRHGGDLPETLFEEASRAEKLVHSRSFREAASKEDQRKCRLRERTPKDEAERERELARLERLAQKMWIDGRRINEKDDNFSIPAGYTYLGQLIAHDLTFNASPLPQRSGKAGVAPSLASAALDLDCIYAGRPEKLPSLYQVEFRNGEEVFRKRLRVGMTRPDLDPSAAGKNAEVDVPRPDDLPRICIDSPDNTVTDKGKYDGPSEKLCPYDALIGDSRNEDNLILSQLTVLFHKLHNKIVDRLETMGGGLSDRDIFNTARAVTVKCYQTIIVEDFLMRLLDEEVYETYRNEKTTPSDFTQFKGLLHKNAKAVIPIEFSLAAFRFGHAMVRQKYALNETFKGEKRQSIGRLMSFRGPLPSDDIPLTNKWVIDDWSKFFPVLNDKGVPQGKDFNASRRIRPAFAADLYHKRFDPMPAHRKGRAPTPGEPHGGLLYRDLARGYDMGLSSGQEMACVFDVAENSRLSQKVIRKGLERTSPSGPNDQPLSESDVDQLAKDTPLLYYILREAEVQHGGERLGTLGSRIIAEVIFGILRNDSGPGSRISNQEIAAIFAGQGVPKDMPSLIRFVKSGSGGTP